MQLTSVLTCTFTSSAPSLAQHLHQLSGYFHEPSCQLWGKCLRKLLGGTSTTPRLFHKKNCDEEELICHIKLQSYWKLAWEKRSELLRSVLFHLLEAERRHSRHWKKPCCLLFGGGGWLLSFVFSIFSKLLKAPKQTALVTDWVMEWPTDWCHSQRWRCS